MANLSVLFGNSAFKPADVEAVNTDFTPLPKGSYPIHITESEVRPTKAGDGSILGLKIVVQDGKYSRRVLFDNLCVQHSNTTAQAIAQTRLKQICESLKITQLKDSSQLHNKELMVALDVELDKYATERSGGSELVYRNAIKGYAPVVVNKEANAPVDDFEDVPF